MDRGSVHSISRILQHTLSTISTSLHHIITTNPNPRLNPPITIDNSMSSRHVKSFSTIHSYLQSLISVTFATSHWLRSPLKAEARPNTVARQEGRLHSQSTRKKRRREISSDHLKEISKYQNRFWIIFTRNNFYLMWCSAGSAVQFTYGPGVLVFSKWV